MTDEQSAMSLTVEDFLSYVKETKSKHTFKEYRIGIKKFSEWFGKTPNEILEMRKQDWVSGNLHRKKRFTREIEKYHKWLIENQKYSINTARNYCLGILQLFRYYEMPITIPTGSDVSKTVISTKDFVPTPQQYREMYKVADSLRDKLIASMGKDLGWRIGDFVKIEKDMLTYLSEVEHKAAFLKVHQRLRLTETPMRKRRETATELERKVEDLQRLVHGIIALGGKDLVEKAKQTLELEDKDLWLQFKDGSALEMIKQLGDIRRRQQVEEYRKLIMENNNNSNNH